MVFRRLLMGINLLSTNTNKKKRGYSEQKDAEFKRLNYLQTLLDNYIMNVGPAISEGAADDFYLNDSDYNGFAFNRERNIYLWRNTATDGDAGNWLRMYNSILFCNVVLQTLLATYSNQHQDFVNELKGRALFYRSYHFFNLLLLFAKAYHPLTADKDPGIPLHLDSRTVQNNSRESVAACYDQILADLKIAAKLLSPKGSVATRPDQCNTFALLAKVCLFKQDYTMADIYAASSLALNSQLIDYNTLNPADDIPFIPFNQETIFYATGVCPLLFSNKAKIHPDLYRQYGNDDLRKSLFFKENREGIFQFKGSYCGQHQMTLFTGLTTAEVFLMRAEALARKGQVQKAMDHLNSLLLKRYAKGTFKSNKAYDLQDALKQIWAERRKELVFRGVRWHDLKRLNLYPETALTLHRDLEGQRYTLSPDPENYVFPVPEGVLNELKTDCA